MAVCNDNLWGCSTGIITRHKVRWIEMAAVLPYWTCVMVYYVEGDYGHLMDEEVGQRRWRTAARGHAFSYVMPWEEIVASINSSTADADIADLPRPVDTLLHLFRIHVRVACKDYRELLKQVVLVHPVQLEESPFQ